MEDTASSMLGALSTVKTPQHKLVAAHCVALALVSLKISLFWRRVDNVLKPQVNDREGIDHA